MAAGEKSVSELLRECANRLEASPSTSGSIPSTSSSTPRHPVQAEVARLFAPYARRPLPLPISSTPRSAKKACHSTYSHTFFCLSDHMSDTMPSKNEKFELTAAGLGEKRISFQGRDDDATGFTMKIENTFPQLRDTGGFELLRISGATRSRSLCAIPSPDSGYTVGYLRSPLSGIGQAVIYIRPLQKSIDLESPTTLQQLGPLTKCLSCETTVPLNQMKRHMTKCTSSLEDTEREAVTRQTCNSSSGSDTSASSSGRILPSRVEDPSIIMECSIVSAIAEQSSVGIIVQEDTAGETPEWKCEPDGSRAAWLYKSKLLAQHENKKEVVLQMDLRESVLDQERSLIAFYKAPKVEWANPVRCKLDGDVAVGEGVKRFFFSKTISLIQLGFHLNFGNTSVTRLFDGEPEHLTPSTCQTFLESDMFLVAGRMMGHSFIHGGPGVFGLSPAIIHILLGGLPETATIQIEDCPDIDIRNTIQLLDGKTELSAEEQRSVLQLALSWDLPGVTSTNQKWLYERLLFHAVITRTSRQVKQLRKGLKETMVWPLLTERPDIIPLFFPRQADAAVSYEAILERIVWPAVEEEEEECSVEDQCRVAGYLRTFIENASNERLKALLKFWTGWEMLPRELSVEVVNSNLPKSSTCFEVLRLPAHYQSYESFVTDIQACLNTTDCGFGLV